LQSKVSVSRSESLQAAMAKQGGNKDEIPYLKKSLRRKKRTKIEETGERATTSRKGPGEEGLRGQGHGQSYMRQTRCTTCRRKREKVDQLPTGGKKDKGIAGTMAKVIQENLRQKKGKNEPDSPRPTRLSRTKRIYSLSIELGRGVRGRE